jgi:hypothetical protein
VAALIQSFRFDGENAMRRKPAVVLFAVLASAGLTSGAFAQSVALSGRFGILGVGGEANVDFGRRFGVRGGVGAVPLSLSGTDSDGETTIQLPSTLSNVGADVYPFGGHFRLSGGVLFKHDVSFSDRVTGTIDLNDRTYTAAQAGTINGKLTWSSVAPYTTFGFSSRGKRFGMWFDLGAAFLGAPAFTLTSTGPATQNDAQFRADLSAEQKKTQDDARKYLKILPVLSLGVRWGL